MADLAPEKSLDALSLSKVAQQLLVIQTHHANHVADLEKCIANLSDEIKLKVTEVETRDAQIASLQLELDKNKLDQARRPRKPLVMRLPPTIIRGPKSPLSSLSSSLDSSEGEAPNIFNVNYRPIKVPTPRLRGITTKAGGRSETRIGEQSRTGPSRAVAPCFQDIPHQIQRIIWRYSMPAPQVLELRKVPQEPPQQTHGGNASTAPPKYVLIGDLPAAFHTCQLSRVEILRAYSRLARKKTTQNDEVLVKRADKIDSYADLRRDTVYIGGMESRTIEGLHQDLDSWPLFNNVQYLAVEMGVWKPLVERRHMLYDLLHRAKSLREIAIVVGEERSVPEVELGKPMLLVDCHHEDHEEERRGMEAMISGLLQGSFVKPPKMRMCRLRRRPVASVIRDTEPTLTSILATPSLVQKPENTTGRPAAKSKVSDDQPVVAPTKGDFNYSFALGDLSLEPPSFTPRSGVACARKFRSRSSRVREAYISDGNQVPRFDPVPPDAAPGNLPFTFMFGQPKAE